MNSQNIRIVSWSLLFLGANGTVERLHGAEPAPRWEETKSVELKGLTVTVSKPRLIARSKGYLWFPTLVRLDNDDLLAIMNDYPDRHTHPSTSRTAFSRDGGLTWSEPKPALYSDTHLRLPGGDEILLPYYLFSSREGLVGPYQRVPRGKRVLEVVKDGVTVTGWPRPVGILDAKFGLGGFVFNGQTVTLKKGGYLATLYGHFKEAKLTSLVAAESSDGLHWKVRATIADEKCKLKGFGPSEAALCRLKDGRLLCVFRVAGGGPSYGQCFSSDEGKTWTEPVAMVNVSSVQPCLVGMPDGTVVLSGGRPGVKIWFNRDGTGKDWQPFDLAAHHTACVPREPITHPKPSGDSSCYTELVAVDDTHLLCIYDRIPHGWNAIPKDSTDTNSVWVVRLELKRK